MFLKGGGPILKVEIKVGRVVEREVIYLALMLLQF